MSTLAGTHERTTGQAVYRTSVWSTRVDLVVTDPAVVVAAAAILRQELDHVDRVASRFRPDSEISALRRAADAGHEMQVSPDLLEAISLALRAALLTGGAVDPTVGTAVCRLGYDRDFPLVAPGVAGSLPEPAPVPGWQSVTVDTERATVAMPAGIVLDLGATAKAWAADRAAAAIWARLGCGVLVSLGGDLSVQGAPDDGFSVGIADICGDTSSTLAVAVSSGGLATSGVGNRHWSLGGQPVHHLVDPTTGLPVRPVWKTVSVAAATCVDANTASTAAMVKGKSAPAWLESRRLPARLVRPDDSTVTLAGWPAETPSHDWGTGRS
ncbi:MAG TPA: FAD:protein FMN transferase [Acidimicrobiales bacterium]|nr:FAD:protein FMN transferase [Acidimicrobiales bacterium]